MRLPFAVKRNSLFPAPVFHTYPLPFIGHELDTKEGDFKKSLIFWRALGDSNPCYRREREAKAPIAVHRYFVKLNKHR